VLTKPDIFICYNRTLSTPVGKLRHIENVNLPNDATMCYVEAYVVVVVVVVTAILLFEISKDGTRVKADFNRSAVEAD